MHKRALLSAGAVASRRNSRYPGGSPTRTKPERSLESRGPLARYALTALVVAGLASAMLGLLQGSTDLSDQLRAGLFALLLIVQMAAVAIRGTD